MLKTNSKQAINNIKTYIVNNFNGENYGIETSETFEEVAREIYKDFCRCEWSDENTKRYFGFNQYKAFKYWCSGLPSIIDTCYFYNRSAVEDLGDILEETEAERSKYTEEEAEDLLTKLIYREIIKEVE